MKVLLIYNGAENLGIEYLSSVLKKHGHKVFFLFDPAFFSGDQLINSEFLARVFSVDKKLVEKAAKIKPDIVGFSTFSGNYLWCLKIAQSLKEIIKAPIVFGGIHATAVPEKVLSNDFVDYVIVGEGEYALLDLVEHLEKGAPFYFNYAPFFIITVYILFLADLLSSFPSKNQSVNLSFF